MCLVSVDHDGSDTEGMTRQYKEIPTQLEQESYESEEHFFRRIHKLASKAKAEATIEDKYDVDFCKKVISTEGDNEALNAENKEKKSDNKRKRRKEKVAKRLKKKKGSEDEDDFAFLQDKVEFGEIVTCPPNLNFKLKKNKKQ